MTLRRDPLTCATWSRCQVESIQEGKRERETGRIKSVGKERERETGRVKSVGKEREREGTDFQSTNPSIGGQLRAVSLSLCLSVSLSLSLSVWLQGLVRGPMELVSDHYLHHYEHYLHYYRAWCAVRWS